MTENATPVAPAFKSRVFLWGADMNPTAIRARWPRSRFVAIACATGILSRSAGLRPNAFGPEIWGIMVETGEDQRGTLVPLTLAHGASATAMVVDAPGGFGTPAGILAEARYWELPQAYRDRIEAFIDTADAP
ncbi:MAG: hypothetical protein H0V37_14315 [Chloroflexia bacterium]|nr:hypothetical protein [Chloroflexia bacterium]